MFYRIRNRAREHLFDYRTRGVLASRPIEIDSNSELTIVTMLCHQDVGKYLIAIKSLYAHIGQGEIIIIDDSTLTGGDRDLISGHIIGSQIVAISTIDTGLCPVGNTWERLLLILEKAKSRYVIQMDADTLTIGNVDEVLSCYSRNWSFTLGTASGRSFSSLRDAASFAHDNPNPHISIVAERQFVNYPDCDGVQYVRGSSGFAGFAKGCFSRDRLEEFSSHMAGLVGGCWTEWGSEQIASNFVVANSPSAIVLPYPKYTCFHPGVDPAQCVFLHFIGTHRFKRGTYDRLALQTIDAFQP